MHYWKPGDLSQHPTPKSIVRRKPWKDYWESNSSDKQAALETFLERWEAVTGTPHGVLCLQCAGTGWNCRGQLCYCQEEK